MSFWNRIFGRKGGRREPEKKRLEGSALVGTNVLDLGPWEGWKPKPPEENRLGNLVIWSLSTPFIVGGEPMVIDRVGRYIYLYSSVLRSLYRLDFEGNPKGRLRLPDLVGRLAMSHDGKLLVSSGSWLYRVDPEGQVISAVENPGGFDVLPDGTIVGVSSYEKVSGWCKTILGFVREGKVHEVDVSAIMIRGHNLRCSPDGFLYVVGAPPSTTFVGNTVFKLDPAGNLVNSCSIFKHIGAICPTHDGGVDVLEIDGSRLVRLSREMKVVYDSQRDSRPEARLLFHPRVLYSVQAMDVDDAGNCYVLSYGALRRFRRFWEETAVPERIKPAKPFVNAMFVFNSDEISDKVSSLYGAYAQGEILKALSRGLETLGGWET